MFNRFLSVLLAAAFAGVFIPDARADEPPSREQIAQRGKASTAFFECGNPHGTAFCVHPSGYFVTAHRLAQPGRSRMKLILDPQLKTQRTLDVRVVRRDKALDLALLKVIEDGKFESLSLGSDDGLAELSDVFAFGFPDGPHPDREKQYPAISVKRGTVTSLRRDAAKALNRIQFDGDLKYGNTGGPILDSRGKVLGVVIAGIEKAGVNLAIPVSHLERFLSRPEIAIYLPSIDKSNRDKELEFAAKMIVFTEPKNPHELELVVRSGAGVERRFAMKRQDGKYSVKAVPFPAGESFAPLRLAINTPAGEVTGTADDQSFRIGAETAKLSQLRGIRLGSKPQATLSGGRVLEGQFTDLKLIAMTVGKEVRRLDPAVDADVAVEYLGDGSAACCDVIARIAGKDIGRASVPLYVQGVSKPSIEWLAEEKYVRPPRSVVPITYLRMISSQNDSVGLGKSYFYEGEELHARKEFRRNRVIVQAADWWFHANAAEDRLLAVGEYADARRTLQSNRLPGLILSGYSRGVGDESRGRFVVWEVEMKGEEVFRLAIDFVQDGRGKGEPLYGSVRINSTFH